MKKKILLFVTVSMFILSNNLAAKNIEPEKKFYNTPKIELRLNDNLLKEFLKSPVDFLNHKIDLSNFKIENHKKWIQVKLYSNKGIVTAIYNKNLNLQSMKMKFKNFYPSRDLIESLYNDYPGWEISNFKLSAVGNEKGISEEIYRLRIIKNGKIKRVKYIF